MAKGFDILNVKSARKDMNKMDLSCTHLTTMDFGQIVPLYVNELVPGDKFSIKGNYFSRMAPLVKPTYGKFSFKTVAGFVPYYQLADEAEAYLSGKTVQASRNTAIRYFTFYEYVRFLVNLVDSNHDDPTPTAGVVYDWKYFDTSGSAHYVKFTTIGKLYVKIMNALGYALPQSASLETTSAWYAYYNTSGSEKKLNAMPLLAYAKLYNDWMSQSQRYNTSALTQFLDSVRHNQNVTGYNVNTYCLLNNGIKLVLDNIRLCYENDYFTSAWLFPNSPLNTGESVASAIVPKASGATGNDVTLTNGTYNNYFTSGQPVSQRMLDFLKSFDDWVRRNNYSGSRAVQQIYSRFGIKTEDYRSNYAHVISTDTMPIQVGDVTDTAGASGSPLGDYAGKGIMNGSDGFSFDASDYGVLLILGYYTVQPMMSYGFDRSVLRTEPLDFYNPEFDGMGADAISYGEVFTNPVPTSDSTLDNLTYGFTERYNAYRFGRDKITGDFRTTDGSSGNANVWHTGRLLNQVRASSNMVAQSTSMINLAPIDSEYDRIFSITGGYVDHFYMTAQFNVSAVRPMMSLNQVPRLGEGNTSVPRNGNVIS